MSKHYPIFIPSKHRCGISGTAYIFAKCGIEDYRIIVEADDLKDYRNKYGTSRVLELPRSYLENYETLDEYGTEMAAGPGAPRNYAKDLAAAEGAEWFWTFDDNLTYALLRYDARGFRRDWNGARWFAGVENLITQFNNVAIGGPHSFDFIAHGHQRIRRYVANTRVYSVSLMRTAIPFRWRGRYNDDTILSLDVLRAGWATILSNEWLMKKNQTQIVKGGLTEHLYKYGTGPKSRMLATEYPEYAVVTERFKRIHHFIDYKKHFGHIPLHI